jgi:hypothetical protein
MYIPLMNSKTAKAIILPTLEILYLAHILHYITTGNKWIDGLAFWRHRYPYHKPILVTRRLRGFGDWCKAGWMVVGNLRCCSADLIACCHSTFSGLSARMWGSTCSLANSRCSMIISGVYPPWCCKWKRLGLQCYHLKD